MSKKINFIVFMALLIIGGIASIFLGQDLNWDIIYYHLYNPYAFLNNRLDMDFITHSYFNPLMDIPYYLMITKLSNFPRLVAFIQGLYYGIAAFLVWLISFKFFKVENKSDYFFPVSAFIISATSTILLLEIGRTFNDVQVAIGILLSIYILMCNLFEKPSKKRLWLILLAGFIAGGISGLKMTGLLFCGSIFFAILFSYKKIDSPKKIFLLFVFGCIAGFLITNGFWMYKMWAKFQNPVFPMFNKFFKSSYYILYNALDKRYVPDNILKAIFVPPYPHSGGAITEIDRYVDYRFLIAYIAAFIWTIFTFIKSKIVKSSYNKKKVIFLLVFTVSSYFIWMYQFSILRYLLPVLCLTGIIITLFIKDVFKLVGFQYQAVLIISIMFFVFFTSDADYKYERFKSWEKTLHVEALLIEDDAIVFIDLEPWFYMPPVYLTVFQNPKAHYIGISFNEQQIMTMNYSKFSYPIYEKVINDILSDGKKHKFYCITSFYNMDNNKIQLIEKNSQYVRISLRHYSAQLKDASKVYYLCEFSDDAPIFFEYINPEKTKIKFKENL